MTETRLKGQVYQIIGPVIDIRFEGSTLPNIYNSIEIIDSNANVVAEVQQMIGSAMFVRTISMNPTERRV